MYAGIGGGIVILLVAGFVASHFYKKRQATSDSDRGFNDQRKDIAPVDEENPVPIAPTDFIIPDQPAFTERIPTHMSIASPMSADPYANQSIFFSVNGITPSETSASPEMPQATRPPPTLQTALDPVPKSLGIFSPMISSESDDTESNYEVRVVSDVYSSVSIPHDDEVSECGETEQSFSPFRKSSMPLRKSIFVNQKQREWLQSNSSSSTGDSSQFSPTASSSAITLAMNANAAAQEDAFHMRKYDGHESFMSFDSLA